MLKTISIRLNDETYDKIKSLAERYDKPISNLIESAVCEFIEQNSVIDESEMTEIRSDLELNRSLKRGLADMKSVKGRFI